jgi:hypothetical protein
MRLGFKVGGVHGTIRESSHGGEVMGDQNKGILWDVGGIIRRDVVGDKGFLFHVD